MYLVEAMNGVIEQMKHPVPSGFRIISPQIVESMYVSRVTFTKIRNMAAIFADFVTRKINQHTFRADESNTPDTFYCFITKPSCIIIINHHGNISIKSYYLKFYVFLSFWVTSQEGKRELCKSAYFMWLYMWSKTRNINVN